MSGHKHQTSIFVSVPDQNGDREHQMSGAKLPDVYLNHEMSDHFGQTSHEAQNAQK